MPEAVGYRGYGLIKVNSSVSIFDDILNWNAESALELHVICFFSIPYRDISSKLEPVLVPQSLRSTHESSHLIYSFCMVSMDIRLQQLIIRVRLQHYVAKR